MAQKAEIQYVDRFYVYGSEVPKPAPQRKSAASKKEKEPQSHEEKLQKVYIDPVALCCVVAAAVMLCVLVSGAFRLRSVRAEYDASRAYLSQMKRDHASKEHQYRISYDLEEIRKQAEKMGMINASNAERFTVFLDPDVPVEEQSDIQWFFSTLFSGAGEGKGE